MSRERIVSLDAQAVLVPRLMGEPFYLIVEEPAVHDQAHAAKRPIALPAGRAHVDLLNLR